MQVLKWNMTKRCLKALNETAASSLIFISSLNAAYPWLWWQTPTHFHRLIINPLMSAPKINDASFRRMDSQSSFSLNPLFSCDSSLTFYGYGSTSTLSLGCQVSRCVWRMDKRWRHASSTRPCIKHLLSLSPTSVFFRRKREEEDQRAAVRRGWMDGSKDADASGRAEPPLLYFLPPSS